MGRYGNRAMSSYPDHSKYAAHEGEMLVSNLNELLKTGT
jgi:hypothetical protein